MQVEVYPTDAEAIDAAAALVAERVRGAAARGRAVVALGGSRSSRAALVALSSRGDLPWAKVEWCLADERCSDPTDPLAHAKVARDSLFVPRGIAAARIHAPVLEGTPQEVAARYAAALEHALEPDEVFDLVVLGIGDDGALGVLTSGCAALEARESVAVVPTAGAGEPSRVSLTAHAIGSARYVIVTAVGPQAAVAVAAALRDGTGPAARVLPSQRVTWVIDRDAAGVLLATATPVEGAPAAAGLLPR